MRFHKHKLKWIENICDVVVSNGEGALCICVQYATRVQNVSFCRDEKFTTYLRTHVHLRESVEYN
jgi:hypothetical protein